jgi:hypothetical protein|tara:strand:- start:209 stop:445 length:237 start_codon:yes stop_codon:yes gene_type:complete
MTSSGDIKDLGAFQRRFPTGGIAYGISSQVITFLLNNPWDTPDDVEMVNEFSSLIGLTHDHKTNIENIVIKKFLEFSL